MRVHKKGLIARTPYEQFRYNLETENPRAAYWLESMVYGMMAQIDGMTEDGALELACNIVAGPTRPENRARKPYNARNRII